MSHRSRVIISLAVCMTVIVFAGTASAQSVPNVGSSLILTPSSSSPSPGQELTVKAESYIADLNAATIIWTVAGKEYKRGIGVTQITVIAPANGKSLVVTAVASTLEGDRLSNSLILGTGDVELIIESDGYVPPFFKGKFPVTFQNSVKVTAIPHLFDSSGKEYPAASLVYDWKKDWKVLQSESGYGKQSISLVGDIVPRPYTLILTVSSRDGKVRAERVVNIIAGEPSIFFYISDPLYGILYNRARGGSISLGSMSEVSIIATPYGFNKGSGTKGLAYDWSVNGALRNELASNESITLRAPGDTGGTAQISLQIRNTKELLQGSLSGFTAIFSKKKDQSSNILQ